MRYRCKLAKRPIGLLDFFVDGIFAHDRVVFFQLDALRGVFAVFLRYITRSARQTAVFVLRTFQNHLDTVASAFLCHDAVVLRMVKWFFKKAVGAV